MNILAKRRTKEMKNLSEGQVDMIHCIRYSYFMVIGKRNLLSPPPTIQEIEDITSFYNVLIGFVNSKEIECEIKNFN